MKLSDKQRAFTRMIADIIVYAYNAGYELTFCDAYRDPRLHGPTDVKKGYGSANSVHKVRLAVDFNLFVNGQFIQDSNHPAWDDLHILGVFGWC